MMDWVQGLDMKLREMHILSPKENVYTKPPESRPPLLPTRDPNSPLPPPPALQDLPINILPGVEPVIAVAQSIYFLKLLLLTLKIKCLILIVLNVFLLILYVTFISGRDDGPSSDIEQTFLTPPISPNSM